MALEISPHFTADHFQEPLSLEQKIALFSDRVRGWQLDIAEWLKSHPHAGFAVLSVVSSYFEMIAKYEDGYVGNRESKRYFKRGVQCVLGPLVQPAGRPIPDALLNLLYEEVRCGMYHAGITGPRVRLSGDAPLLSLDADVITLNPHLLVSVLQDHFSRYVALLFDLSNTQLRQNFEARFDRSISGKRLGR